MDSSSSSPPNPQDHQNYAVSYNQWLGFSLNPNPDLSLFHPFFNPLPTGNHFSHQQDVTANTGGPKLEDFLGGSGIYPNVPDPNSSSTALLHGYAAADQEFGDFKDTQKTVVVSAAAAASEPPVTAPRKTADNFGHRTSIYRGVTRHRWTGRYEAHLWDNSCKREGQSRKGRQVYLGGYDKEEKAARAYDLAALKYWGPTTTTNFPVSDYEKELEDMQHMTRQEFVASLRRKSSGFSRGASIYRGVTRHHQHGRWQARIGRVAGNKDLYLGTFSTQEEAAEAYDIAAIKFRGTNAVTNFDISRYDVKSIATSNLPVGGLSNKSSSSPKPTSSISDTKHVSNATIPFHMSNLQDNQYPSPSSSSTISFAIPTEQTVCWPNQAGFHVHHEQDPTHGGFFGYGEHQQVDTCTSEVGGCKEVSYPEQISSALSSEYGGGDHGARSCAAKPSLSTLHTLIFGME